MITDEQRTRYAAALSWFAEEMKNGPCGPRCQQCAAYLAAIEALSNLMEKEEDDDK